MRKTGSKAEREMRGIQLLEDDLSKRTFESVRGRALKQIKLEKELRDAFASRELDLYFQPIVSLNDYRVSRFEALIRWNSLERGVIGPGELISMAEETGLLVQIGLWVLEHACHMVNRFRAIRSHKHPNAPAMFMSANVSARQLRDLNSVDAMIATIRQTGIDPSTLKIEITEGLLLDDPEIAIEAFTRFKGLGVIIALDDFGTGYSSLSYLHRFAMDTLKIVRSLIRCLKVATVWRCSAPSPG